jgi:hypothetical protein
MDDCFEDGEEVIRLTAPWLAGGFDRAIVKEGVTGIGAYAFYRCESLTSVTIPHSVTTIGEWAFMGCESLTSIAVDADNPDYTAENGVLFNKAKTVLVRYPEGKTETGYTLPHSVTTIGEGAFIDCESLTSVIIPHSVTAIGNYAFIDCDGLTSVTIPHSVTAIGDKAFVDCSSLRDVTVEWATPLSIPGDVFSDPDNIYSEVDLTECTLHVPSGMAARYRAADVWKDFGQIVEQ